MLKQTQNEQAGNFNCKLNQIIEIKVTAIKTSFEILKMQIQKLLSNNSASVGAAPLKLRQRQFRSKKMFLQLKLGLVPRADRRLIGTR